MFLPNFWSRLIKLCARMGHHGQLAAPTRRATCVRLCRCFAAMQSGATHARKTPVDSRRISVSRCLQLRLMMSAPSLWPRFSTGAATHRLFRICGCAGAPSVAVLLLGRWTQAPSALVAKTCASAPRYYFLLERSCQFSLPHVCSATCRWKSTPERCRWRCCRC